MPVPIHLLERAYQLINANQLQNAELVLDAVVRVDPQNVEAWKTYLLIHQSQHDLDWLKERIIKSGYLSKTDKTKLIDYHSYLTKQLNGAEEAISQTHTFALPLLEEKEETAIANGTTIQFELIDVFDYPTKIVKKETSTRTRKRAIYTTFALDIALGALKAISRDPVGKKVTVHIEKTITLVSEFIKNPKNIYARFSKSSHFEKYIEFALLALFVLGARLVISNHFLGYITLGIFVIGGRWWLINFGNRNTTTLNGQVRVYMAEDKNKLPVIEEMEIDQEQESDEENFG